MDEKKIQKKYKKPVISPIVSMLENFEYYISELTDANE